MAKIVVRYQNQILGEFVLKPGFNEIGRLSKNSIHIDNPGISRHHAFILGDVEGKIFVIEDLQSLNGTYANKRRVHKHLLRPGDVVTLGQHTFDFIDHKPQPELSPAPKTDIPHLIEEESGRIYSLSKDVIFFGNSSADDIQIPSLMVGKNFASISRKGTMWVINLLVKRFSQLCLNGEEIHSSKLSNGDVIEVAGVKFVFHG